MAYKDDKIQNGHQSSAPPGSGGADGDIDFLDAAGAWLHDDEGYPVDDAASPDPERLPEFAGMAEDALERADAGHAAGLAARPPEKPGEKAAGSASPRDDGGLFSFGEIGSHLDELRRRLIICLCVFVPAFGAGLYLYRSLWDIVILPLERAAPHLSRFQALNPSDGLIMAMRIAFAFAAFLCLPVWISQVWHFISPGLTSREKRWLYLSLGSGGVLFAIGAAMAYFAAIPYALEYLLPFNQSMAGWENSFTGTGYVDFVITCCAGFGIAFELPLAMLVLSWCGILTPEAIRSWWRVIILGVFILAAIMTPPDPFTQTLLALPLLLLFLIGYLLVKWSHRPEKNDS